MIKWMSKMVKKMEWYDIGLIKWTTLFATLFLVTVWPWFHDLVMSVAWYWFLAIMIILMIPLLKKMFYD